MGQPRRMRLRGKRHFKPKRVSHHDCEKDAQKTLERRDLRRREKSAREAAEWRFYSAKRSSLVSLSFPSSYCISTRNS